MPFEQIPNERGKFARIFVIVAIIVAFLLVIGYLFFGNVFTLGELG